MGIECGEEWSEFADNVVVSSTLVYVEGDAAIRQFEDAEGKKHSNLSIVQRKLILGWYSGAKLIILMATNRDARGSQTPI